MRQKAHFADEIVDSRHATEYFPLVSPLFFIGIILMLASGLYLMGLGLSRLIVEGVAKRLDK